jgi:FixJ family two-component response regulator
MCSVPQRTKLPDHNKTSGERPYVGVVDNDEAVRHSIRVLLESHGLQVAEFDSAENALRSSLFAHCHCLIVDMELPQMNGLQLVETMRKGADQTPVILLASNPHFSEPDRIRKSNILALLVKPVPQNELLAWIRHSSGA